MAIKWTFFFESVQQSQLYASSSLGFTETWYTADAVGTLDSIINGNDPGNALSNYIFKRTACLHVIYRIAWVRGTVLNPNGTKTNQTKLRSLVAGQGQYGAPSPSLSKSDQAPAQVNCCVLVDFQKLPVTQGNPPPPDFVHHRRFLLRGLNTGIINGNIVNPSDPNIVNIRNFFNYVANHETGTNRNAQGQGPWGVRYENPATPLQVIGGIVVNGTNNRTIDVTGLGATVLGNQYTIRKADAAMPRVNRVWTVLVPGPAGAATVTTLGTARKTMVGNYASPGPGTAQLVAYLFGLFDQYTIIGLRNKKTGRIFRLTRGRRSASR